MTFKTKRSNSMIGKTDAKKKQVHGEPSPDEAPALATKRCRYGYPAPVTAKNAPPPSAHRPVRYARPPDLYEIVCAFSPTELMYHLYEMPAELANLTLPVVHTLMSTVLLSARRWTQCMCFQMMGPSCELWVVW